MIACWLASGIVFGFAALKPVLVDVGVYRELCTPEELLDDVDVCFEQDLRYAVQRGLDQEDVLLTNFQTQLLLCHCVHDLQRLSSPCWYHPR